MSQLLIAIKKNNIILVNNLLRNNEYDLNYKDGLNKSALEHAVDRKNINIIKLLLKKGADVDEMFSNGKSALYNSLHAEQSEIAEIFIQHGADISSGEKGNNYMTFLDFVIKRKYCTVFKALIKKGVSLNVPSDLEKADILSKIIHQQDLENIQFLLDCEFPIYCECVSHGCLPFDHNAESILKEAVLHTLEKHLAKILVSSGHEAKYQEPFISYNHILSDPKINHNISLCTKDLQIMQNMKVFKDISFFDLVNKFKSCQEIKELIGNPAFLNALKSAQEDILSFIPNGNYVVDIVRKIHQILKYSKAQDEHYICGKFCLL